MKNIRILLTFIILCFCFLLQAQDRKENARKYFASQNYNKALPLYRELLLKFPAEPEYQYCTGVCLVQLNGNLEEAINLLRPSPVAAYTPLSLYYLGRALHLNYSFEDAIKAYSRFMMKASKADIKKYDVVRLIEMSRNGIEYTRKSQVVIVQTAEKVSPDHLQLLTGINGTGKVIRKPVEFCTKTDMRNSYRPWMFLPSYTEVNDYIYVSGYERGKKNNKQIFRIRNINHETWGFPEVISDVINTPYDEEFPYFDIKTSTLYFSSNGHSSMGGYDIFKSVYDWNTKIWSKPENLGFPVNSPYDDYAFITDDLSHTVSFVSERNCSGNEVEIFRIRMNENRVSFNNIDEVRKASELAVLPESKPVMKDSIILVKEPIAKKEKSDYNKVLSQALQLQIKADSFARITRDLRVMAKETPDDSLKKQLVTDILRNDKMAKSIQREADAKFTEANSMKGKTQVYDSVVKPFEEINDIKVFQYKSEPVKRNDEFIVLEKSPYSDSEPIPMIVTTDTGLVYRVQLGAFSKAKPNGAFGGISPVGYEQLQGSNVLKYYAGKFFSHNGVTSALEIIRSQGFPDAFIVAFYNGKPITTEKAREIEFSGFRL